jgi:hypothetical protein
VAQIAQGKWFKADAATRAYGCIATFECPECQYIRSIHAQLNSIDAKGIVTPRFGACRCGFEDAIQLIGWSP